MEHPRRIPNYLFDRFVEYDIQLFHERVIALCPLGLTSGDAGDITNFLCYIFDFLDWRDARSLAASCKLAMNTAKIDQLVVSHYCGPFHEKLIDEIFLATRVLDRTEYDIDMSNAQSDDFGSIMYTLGRNYHLTLRNQEWYMGFRKPTIDALGYIEDVGGFDHSEYEPEECRGTLRWIEPGCNNTVTVFVGTAGQPEI